MCVAAERFCRECWNLEEQEIRMYIACVYSVGFGTKERIRFQYMTDIFYVIFSV